jgi:hypothetical protein
MRFWRKLFGTPAKSADIATCGQAVDGERRLAALAFLLKAKTTEPPSGSLTEEQQTFLPRLIKARSAGAAHRRDFCLPLSGELDKGNVKVNAQAGADWIFQEAVKGTAWKCS